jgi:hypothetical protein
MSNKQWREANKEEIAVYARARRARNKEYWSSHDPYAVAGKGREA